jgi:hypothetical protein
MRNMHPITLLAFILFGAVGLAQVSYIASGPHGVTPTPHVAKLEAQPAPGQELRDEVQVAAATPNHDPHRIGTKPTPTTETAAVETGASETAAVPQPDPLSLATKPQPVDSVASLIVATGAVATPNHDPEHRRPAPSFALDPVTLHADPEPATLAADATAAPASPASAPPSGTVAFVHADTKLFAKGNARLRAAPSTSAEIVTKLAADAPLQAVARSSDGAWWQVSYDGGHTGYVHRNAVSKTRIATSKPAAEPMPVVAVAATQPEPARRGDTLLGYVDQTMNWFVDTAGRGRAPTSIRPER